VRRGYDRGDGACDVRTRAPMTMDRPAEIVAAASDDDESALRRSSSVIEESCGCTATG